MKRTGVQRVIPLVLLVLSICGASANAQSRELSDWLEMSDVCEALVFDSDDSVFDSFAPAEPIVDYLGYEDVILSHPSSSLVVSAVSHSNHWFLCTVASNPPLDIRDADALKSTWAEIQFNLAQEPNNAAIDFGEGTIFAPVRVRCGAEGKLAVIMAFTIDGEFKIGVNDSLPSRFENPCRP
ncbi:hypothetical protein [Cochlodiniinecator piscidefendens]|uniref:hypothetical protein n=1 Tax=Cochlodiniinecator piscidefendens TaxID=2715756 RepID=UPI0014097EC2|nr:hypothetical protein [Cochlodiniinecator piscidefendens]